ncbi:MAG: 50S ribosomal protein L9 [Minisyncoccia bacterium]
MKVILLKDIKGVGKRYEEKNVSDGHALNFLIPNKMAVSANANSAEQIKQLKAKMDQKKDGHNKKLQENLDKLKGMALVIKTNANEKNHLFASLTKEKISEFLLKEKNIEIPAEYIMLENPIKELGAFEIEVKVGGTKQIFTLEVQAK